MLVIKINGEIIMVTDKQSSIVKPPYYVRSLEDLVISFGHYSIDSNMCNYKIAQIETEISIHTETNH